VRWRPFELNRDLPAGKGINKMEMYNQKFGEARTRQIIPQMAQVGQSVGINFSYGGNVGNTFDSHRLIWYARKVGGSEAQDKIVESVFKAYFEEEKCLSDVAVLQDCAREAGLDATNLLSDSAMGEVETKAEQREFGRSCRGVPKFIFNGNYAVGGAQESDTLLEIFKGIADE